MIGKNSGKNNPMYNRPSPRRKKVSQVDRNTNKILATYSCLKEAGEAVGLIRGGHISDVCQGKRKTAGGFKWEYVD